MHKILKQGLETWKKQGRTTDEIHAVRNFLSGSGQIAIQDILDKEFDDGFGCGFDVCKELLIEKLKDNAKQASSDERKIINKIIKELK